MNQLNGFSLIFFDYLNKLDINYCVLGRSFSNYVDDHDGDIDIVVSKKDIKKIEEILIKLTRNKKFYLIQNIQHEINSNYYIIYDKTTLISNITRIDVCSDYICNNKLIIRSDFLLTNRKKIILNGVDIYISNNSTNFIYYFAKKIIKNSINNTERLFLKHLYDLNKIECESLLKELFSPNIIEFANQIINSNQLIQNNDLINKCKRYINKYNFSNFVRNNILNIKRLLKRYRNQTGISIAFLGPDGGGKSTLIKNLREELDHIGRKHKIVHFWPNKEFNINLDKVNLSPHASKPYNFYLSILKLIYIFLRYQFETLFINKFQRIKSTIIWFDRHYIDLLVDPRRYKIQKVTWLTKILLKFIRKPDILFIVDVNPEILRLRVNEVSLRENQRQFYAYKRISNNFESFLLNGNSSIENIVLQAKIKIIEKLANRTTDKKNLNFS